MRIERDTEQMKVESNIEKVEVESKIEKMRGENSDYRGGGFTFHGRSSLPLKLSMKIAKVRDSFADRVGKLIIDERGDVPGWVLVVLMTTGLVTGIWTVAAPRIESLLRGSLDSMNNVR